MAFTVWQVGPELKVNEITDGDQQAPSVTALADGGWVVAWQSMAQDGTGWNIHQRRYDGAGVPDGAESIVNVATGQDQQSPGVTALADGGWIVTWQGDEPGGAPGDVYQRRYDGTGAPVTDDILVNQTTAAPQVIPTAAALADGGWVVTWSSLLQDGAGFGVYQRRYDSQGGTGGPDVLVNATTASDQLFSTVTALAGGGWVVTWQSDGQDGDGAGIYQRRYAATGADSLTVGQDLALGTDADETLLVTEISLNPGDRIDGGGGADTLDLVGAAFDFTGVSVLGIETILMTDAGGTLLGTADKALAQLVDGAAGASDTLVLTGGTFTPAERAALFARRIETVTDASGSYTNAAPTDITLSASAVPENTPGGTTVATLAAVDPDSPGGPFTFALLGDAGGLFALDGNALKIAAALNFEDPNAPKTFALTVHVTDPGGKSFTKALALSLANVNEAPSGLSLSGTTAKELSKAGTVVGTLAAADPDAGSTLAYALVDDAGGRFQIVGNQLQVRNGVKLDYEQEKSHAVTVRAVDGGGLATTKTFTVRVGNVGTEKTSGTSAADVIVGGGGRDTLGGGGGDDRLNGGAGRDQLSGNSGKDAFLFTTKPGSSNVDVLRDVSSKDDAIWLENAVFKGIGSGSLAKPKKLSSDAFHVGPAAADAEDRIIYDKATGGLYYDRDGTGAAAQVKFATLKKGLALNHHDFFVI